MTDILKCDLCDADAGDDPYHATINGNGHVHICAACFDPQQHDVGVLWMQRDDLLAELKATESRLHEVATFCATIEQQRDELIAALKRWIWLRDTPAGFIGKYGKALREAVDEREAQLSEAEAISRAAIAKAGG